MTLNRISHVLCVLSVLLSATIGGSVSIVLMLTSALGWCASLMMSHRIRGRRQAGCHGKRQRGAVFPYVMSARIDNRSLTVHLTDPNPSPRSESAALGAKAIEFKAVAGELEAESLRVQSNGAVDVVIGEFGDAAAGATDEVVVVVSL